ncbi:mannan endo-1,4-beta-mannosidase [Chlorella sorokiniana]|uniref:mannan endo-1,4-beta-mannosidase n=1 Tax=Chlorella sorokiniana TaxID=3076 RepID=A0A2P6TFP5_CHLSO|nr:mannan endo-1,4-beta-mannosidase [Chlorella sorokiniana]|eukprot:PRW32930.1 mannan endo-1,4-beta-mannosidase [Chlorella sorokiniana]
MARFFLADDESGVTLLRGPGEMDETVARGLDFVIAQAAKYGIRLTLVLLNLWKTPYDWFMSPTCRDQVKQYFAAITGRRNTITGLLYRDDPTIMSWSIAPNQLVTTGAEGFFDVSHPMAGYNPASWADYSGQNFKANHAHPGIDYATLHMWPDNWGRAQDMSFGEKWIQAHVQVAAELGIPLLVEEFGKEADEGSISSARDPWFKMVHGLVDSSLASGGPLQGSLFWQWDGPWGPAKGSRSSKSNYVHLEDSTFVQHIIPFARRLAALAATAQPVPGCKPRAGNSVSGATISNSTRPAPPAVQSFGGAPNNRRLLLE